MKFQYIFLTYSSVGVFIFKKELSIVKVKFSRIKNQKYKNIANLLFEKYIFYLPHLFQRDLKNIFQSELR